MFTDLYFLPIIERALQKKDRRRALRRALSKIVDLGRESGYRLGFKQFKRFMEEAKSAHALLTEIQEWNQPVETKTPLTLLNFVVESGGRFLGICRFDRIPGRRSMENMIPGQYRLKMETGRVIWEGLITDKDCLWRKAFPNKPLKLAADTSHHDSRPARTISIMEGIIQLQLFPGIEAGVLEIELRETSGE